MTLEKLQENFILKLLNKTNDFDLSELSQEASAAIEGRIDVHRQTIIENLVNAIQIIYPGIWKLLGNDCAKGVALSYIHEMKYLPNNGMMEDYGREFPLYLATFPSTKNLSYIQDFATYEWYKSECYHAKFTQGISFTDLQSLSEEELDKSQFIFNDTIRFFSTIHAVDDIQDMLNNPELEFISQQASKYFFIINQNKGKVITNRVDKDLYQFLYALYSGKSFGNISDEYVDREDIDLAQFIEFIVINHLVKQIQYNK